MSSTRPRALIEIEYAEAAHEYLRSLPLEHFMEATAQAAQRKITLESLDLVHAIRPEVQIFNELLVQYPIPGQRKPGQVVPDNMVVVWDKPIIASGSYNVPTQPVEPFWVMEYVSKHSKRKDYEDNFDKYEQKLKIPYYLLFYPDTQDLSLYHHTGERYVSVRANGQGRFPIPELELELGLHDGWVRYWFRGELLPLPADLQRELEKEKRRADELEKQLEQERQQLEQQRQQLEQQQQQLDQERHARLELEREIARLKGEASR
jgi:Uma2 family endonuclease